MGLDVKDDSTSEVVEEGITRRDFLIKAARGVTVLAASQLLVGCDEEET